MCGYASRGQRSRITLFFLGDSDGRNEVDGIIRVIGFALSTAGAQDAQCLSQAGLADRSLSLPTDRSAAPSQMTHASQARFALADPQEARTSKSAALARLPSGIGLGLGPFYAENSPHGGGSTSRLSPGALQTPNAQRKVAISRFTGLTVQIIT